MDTTSLKTIDKVTEEILFLTGIDEKKYARVKQFVIKGYQELNLTTIPEGVRIEKFTMDANYIVYLTDEIVQVNAVYYPIDGKLWSLTKTDKIVPTVSLLNGSEYRDSTDGEGVDITLQDGSLLASTGGNNTEGYWYYDYYNRRILFTNVDRSEVLIHYTTSGISLDDETYIPSYCVDAIHHYVLWKMSMYERDRDAQLREENLREFNRQKSICRSIQFNLDEFLDVIYSNYFLGFRRL
jgi:hypothetical protein